MSGKEEAPHPLPAHFGPRGSTSLGGPPTWSRDSPKALGHGVGCRSFDSESEHSILRTDSVRGENFTVVAGCQSLFFRSGKVEVCTLGQAKSIAERGAQLQRGGWAAPMGLHRLLKGVVGTSRGVTGWVQQGAAPLQDFGELQSSRYCRSPTPRPWPWKALTQLSRMERPISCRPFRSTRDAWL